MIPDAVLDLAVAKRLIEPGQAVALRSLARQEASQDAGDRRPEPVDEERLRFVTGFADIFVTIGLLLFLGSVAYLVGAWGGGRSRLVIVAVLAWGLAEFFTRVRRMALPSIVLLVVFAWSAFGAILGLSGAGGGGFGRGMGWLGPLIGRGGDPAAVAGAALATAGLIALHYWRFRVPITVAAGAGALALTAYMVLASAAPALTAASSTGLLLALGVVIFALAMRFDLSDPRRETRRTDIAFWLHLLASPLIVHSVFQGIGAGRGQIDPLSAALVLCVFGGLAAVAILVDRRALLVSGLVYAGVAFSSLIRSAGLVDRTVPVTLLILGALVLLLSAGWAPLRRLVLRVVPPGLARRLPVPLGP